MDRDLSTIASSKMCSFTCPCNLEMDASNIKVQENWLNLLTNNATLESYDRCFRKPAEKQADCNETKAVVYYLNG